MIESHAFGDVLMIRMSREFGGKPLYWVAAFLVDGLLIDTGCDFTSRELLGFLEGREVRQVVNTHYHEDHVGGNRALVDERGVIVYAHPDSVPRIAQRPVLFPYQETVWGYPEPTVVTPIPARLETGRYSFDVIETPGHCAGHVVLMEPAQGWCFIGDIFSRVDPKVIRPGENAGELVESMRRILDAAGERLALFCSVGKVVDDGRAALTACIRYLTGMAGRVQELEKRGMTCGEIVVEIFGGEHGLAQLTNGQFTSENLVRSLLEMRV